MNNSIEHCLSRQDKFNPCWSDHMKKGKNSFFGFYRPFDFFVEKLGCAGFRQKSNGFVAWKVEKGCATDRKSASSLFSEDFFGGYDQKRPEMEKNFFSM